MMRFRVAQPDDVDTVVPLMHASSRDLVDATVGAELVHFGPFRLVGVVRRTAALGRLFAPPSPDAVFLANLCVAPAPRGLGYGTQAIEYASAGRTAELDVSASNTSAERLYVRLGFAVVGVRTAPGFDAFRRMRR